MFEQILLEPEQKELLAYLVETIRSIPRDKRSKFIVLQSNLGDVLHYPGLPRKNRKIFLGDVEVLAREGLVSVMQGPQNTSIVNLLPQGLAYYDRMNRMTGQPTANIEAAMKMYLDSKNFQQKYSQAYKKWAQAEEMLWSSDSADQLTTIGRLSREAFQEFAEALMIQQGLQDVDPIKANDVNRVKAVLDNRANQLAKTERSFLKALLEYWRVVSVLVQRQENGAQKEGKELVWEDARRVVFNVAIVMFEVDKAMI